MSLYRLKPNIRLAAAGLFVLRVLLFVFLFIRVASADPDNLVKSALCDVRVAYLIADIDEVDWPTLYYLNDNFGCRVDLITLADRHRYQADRTQVIDRDIFYHRFLFPFDDSAGFERVLREYTKDRLPDVLIIGDAATPRAFNRFAEKIRSKSVSSNRLFKVLKTYRRYEISGDSLPPARMVTLNSHELLNRYRHRMLLEIRQLLPHWDGDTYRPLGMIRYKLEESNLAINTSSDNFLTGIETLRLTDIISTQFDAGPMKETFLTQAQKFISFFSASQISIGRARAGFVIDGFRELLYLNSHEKALADIPEYRAYLSELMARVERAALKMVGISWNGTIIIRDSPHGAKLKFVAAVSVDGPREVEIVAIRFHPYWDTAAIYLDSLPRTIAPHQSFVREYLVDMERKYLEGEIPDSLTFTVEVAYGQIPLVFTSRIPVWESPDLQIEFEPDFLFVKPIPELDVDRLVTNMGVKVVISKPYNYSGNVTLNLTTPRGMFAGAYRKDIALSKGATTENIRIPFTLSNLFELGIQTQVIELIAKGRPVAADTGLIRIAACQIPDTVQVAFMPDTTGLLEDVLILTETAFRPLTERSLVTADLEAYDVIVIGSGALRNYPSFAKSKSRLESFLRQGGSIVILGQPENWPGDLLPVSLAPSIEIVESSDIHNRLAEAKLLSKPYLISEKNLLSSFFKKQEAAAATVAPSEEILVTKSGATLLSVSRLGDGQLIYCGLPLLEMIARLDIEAIHLFANLLNY